MHSIYAVIIVLLIVLYIYFCRTEGLDPSVSQNKEYELLKSQQKALVNELETLKKDYSELAEKSMKCEGVLNSVKTVVQQF